MKHLLKRMQAKKNKTALPPVPAARSVEEIKQVNNELNTKAAQLQYQVYAYSKELENVNRALESLNYEYAERLKLDAAAKAETTEEQAAQ